MEIKQKRVAAIHDISCFGKCSLTVALPILSAAGIEACPIPTAVLSTHTGGFTGIHINDMTADILPTAKHWQSIGLGFDAIYSGYLGSYEQLDIVSDVFDRLRGDDTLIIVDPVMADHGKLYGGFDSAFPDGMARLCRKADLITPNITEAAFMLGEDYREGPYTEDFIRGLLERLHERLDMGSGTIVLTGVYFDEPGAERGRLGAASYSKAAGMDVALAERVDGVFHGTGDIFTSVLTACIVGGVELHGAMQCAAEFVSECVGRTRRDHPYMTYGVNFEAGLGALAARIDAMKRTN